MMLPRERATSTVVARLEVEYKPKPRSELARRSVSRDRGQGGFDDRPVNSHAGKRRDRSERHGPDHGEKLLIPENASSSAVGPHADGGSQSGTTRRVLEPFGQRGLLVKRPMYIGRVDRERCGQSQITRRRSDGDFE